MSIPAYSIISRELKQLRRFYDSTLHVYQKIGEIQSARSGSRVLKDVLDSHGIRWSRSDRKLRESNTKTEAILRELIFVRAISALETFLTDAIRDVFVVTKTPFMDKTVKIEFSQEDLIANNSPAKIFSRIINRETRKLTSGGFNEFVKYYKKRFNVDLAQTQPGYSKMNEYHDIRHILVHRLGKTDEAFRRKYHVDLQQIAVDGALVNSLLTDLGDFVARVDRAIDDVIANYSSIDAEYNARFVVDILFLKDGVPSCLQSSYQFWAADEYVMMSDVLVGTSPGVDGRVRYYFNGSDRALRAIKGRLRREQQRFSISVVEVLAAFRSERVWKYVPEEVISLVQREMPLQPWPKGVHKEVAKRLGLSNVKVSDAINVLIVRGVFKDQFDGKVF